MTRYALLATFLLAAPLAAQQQPTESPVRPQEMVGDTSMFAPVNLPTANEFRDGSGAPGSRYWQNRASYDIAATLDTATKTLHGRETLRYTNNSPDTLHFVWVQTEQNAFQANSLNSFIFPPNSRFMAPGGKTIAREVPLRGFYQH